VFRLPTISDHALFDDRGRLLALVADGEDSPSPLAFLDVPEGSPPLTRDQISEHLAELDDDQLAEIVEAAVTEGEAIRSGEDPITPEVLARIELLADTREVAEERRHAIAEEERARQEAADAGLARLLPPPGGGDNDDNDSGEDDSGDDQAPPEPLAASAAHSAAQPPQAPAPRRRQTSALPRPGTVPSTPPAPGAPAAGAYAPLRATSALVAAAGLESIGLNTGGEISSRAQLGQAINRKREALRGTSGGDGEKLVVASISTTYPEERQLGGSLDTNTQRIEAATSPEALVAAASYAIEHGALVAAGGLCGPVEQLYDVPVLGSTARPVRDQALANFGADRGGVKWRQHVSFGDFAGATGFWSLADDAAVTGDPDTEPKVKPCIDVECPGDAEAFVEAITWCMTFSNVTSRFDPESTAANVQAGQIAHARIAENRLLAQIAALTTTLTQAGELSFLRDYLTTLDRVFAAYRNFYRLEDNQALRGIGPRWMRDAIRSDLTRGAGFASGTDLNAAMAAATAQINGWLATRNVNFTWHYDGRGAIAGAAGPPVVPAMAAQSYGAFTQGAAVPDYPATVETFLWVEGDMLHLDGGTLDFGVMRDSTLNQVNRYKQFSESFEGVAHRGVEALRLVSAVNPNGMTAGTADTAAILAA
jgi:hypothetical protein